MPSKKSTKRGAILSADEYGDDPNVVHTGVAIRGIEYADDARTSGTKTMKLDRLERVELEASYRRSALIWKGINKKARDVFKAGFELVPADEKPETAKRLNALARAWMRKHKFRPKVEQSLREGYWFGDGFLELVYPGAPAQPAPDGVEPSSVRTIVPWHVRPVLAPRGDPRSAKGEVLAYWYGPDVRTIPSEQVKKWVAGGELPREVVAVLHPSRVAHFQPYPVTGDEDGYGMSVIEAAYLNVISKTVGDHSLGDILEWAGQGFLIFNVDFATEEELKKTKKMVEASKRARKTFFVGSERTKVTTADPVIPNVDSFYKQFNIEFAAALEMPTMILMGVQKGTVSGSSVDIIEYYDDVRAFQDAHVEPVFQPLLERVLNTTEFTIRWTPLYVDKQTRADTTFKMFQSAVGAVGAQFLTRRQAIAFLRRELPDATLPDPALVPDEYVEKPEPSMQGDAPGDGAAGKRGAEDSNGPDG